MPVILGHTPEDHNNSRQNPIPVSIEAFKLEDGRTVHGLHVWQLNTTATAGDGNSGGSIDTSALATSAKQDLLLAGVGARSDLAWDGASAEASVLGLLKALNFPMRKALATVSPTTATASTTMADAPTSDIVPKVDVSGFNQVAVNVRNTGTAQISVIGQISFDGINWVNCGQVRSASVAVSQSNNQSVPSSGNVFLNYGLDGAPFFRLRNYSGTPSSSSAVTATAIALTTPLAPLPVNNMTIGNFAFGATPNPTSSQVAPNTSLTVSTAGTNLTLIKSTGGRLFGVTASNTSTSAWAWLKFYNATATANVTVGTTAPSYVIGLAPNSTLDNVNLQALSFATGMVCAITGGAANSDATAVAANQVVANVAWL